MAVVRERPERGTWIADLGIVDTPTGRKRVRKTDFKTEAEALAFVDQWEAELKNRGTSGFTPLEMAELQACRIKLADHGVSIAEAVEIFRQQNPLPSAPGEVITCNDLLKRWLKTKTRGTAIDKRASSPHLETVRQINEQWFKESGTAGLPANSISAELHLRPWLETAKTPVTYGNWRRNLYLVFNWGVKRKLIARNPVADIEPAVDDDENEIGTLSVEDSRRLLSQCAERDLEMLPELVLLLFCGVRPDGEIGRCLLERDLNLAERTVAIAGKTRARRVVDLSENAAAWLEICPEEVLTGCPRRVGYRNRRKRCREGVYVGPNWLRHTFASYHSAKNQDWPLLQAQMGHRSAAMLHARYRAVRTRKEAEAFWSITP